MSSREITNPVMYNRLTGRAAYASHREDPGRLRI